MIYLSYSYDFKNNDSKVNKVKYYKQGNSIIKSLLHYLIHYYIFKLWNNLNAKISHFLLIWIIFRKILLKGPDQLMHSTETSFQIMPGCKVDLLFTRSLFTICFRFWSPYSASKKWRHIIQMTYNRPIHRLNYQWQFSIHLNWPMVSQYDVIFIGTIKSFKIQVFKPLNKTHF